MIDTICFDLDGTLLPMEVNEFIQHYFKSLTKKMIKSGYDADNVIRALNAATKHMVENDSEETNEQVFWKYFEKYSQIKRETIEPTFFDYYQNDFNSLEEKVEKSPNMIEVVKELKMRNFRLILTTNPLFPKVAVENRVRWAGLDPNDFDYITSFENSHACKPSMKYYYEVIKNAQINIENTMMIGNDSLEDGIIENCGIPLYLVTDYLIHRSDDELKSRWFGTSSELLEFIKLNKMNKK